MKTLYVVLILVYLFIYYVFPSIFNAFLKFLIAVFKRVMIYSPSISPVFAEGQFKEYIPKEDEYDVIIVGAGPAGSSTAFFCAQAGLKVMIIEKETFPKKKSCGNCIIHPGLQILQEMNLLKEFEKKQQIFYLETAGIISPAGYTYSGVTKNVLGDEKLAATIKREHLDEALAKAAEKNGAELKEGEEVTETDFNNDTKFWKISTSKENAYTGRVLILADGAVSAIGTKLGYVKEPPRGICSHMVIEPKTHNFSLDSLVVYAPYTLPGFAALFKNVGDEVNYCHYLAPCGEDEKYIGNINPDDLPAIHNYSSTKDPFISPLITEESVKSTPTFTPIRASGQGVEESFGDHLMIVGDAAGFVDPLTCLGIHNALLSGKQAALTMIHMYEEGDYTNRSTKQYEDRWYRNVGREFEMTKAGVDLIWNYPSAVDTTVLEMQKKGGNKLFVLWASIMTMYQERLSLVTPFVITMLIKGMLKEFIKKNILTKLKLQNINNFNYKGHKRGPFI